MKKINLTDKNLTFNTEEHKYYYRGVECLSVTQFLDEFKKEFDEEKHSLRVSERDGVSQDSVKENWLKRKESALSFGTLIHECADKISKGEPIPDLTGNAKEYVQTIITYFKEHPKLKVLGSEIKVCYPLFKLAGTVDLILYSDDGKVFLYDWKTSKTIDQFSKYKDKMKDPLSNLDDCNFNRYSLQLNLYRLMLENKGLKVNGMYVIHLRSDGYKEYKVKFLDKELDELLVRRLVSL